MEKNARSFTLPCFTPLVPFHLSLSKVYETPSRKYWNLGSQSTNFNSSDPLMKWELFKVCVELSYTEHRWSEQRLFADLQGTQNRAQLWIPIAQWLWACCASQQSPRTVSKPYKALGKSRQFHEKMRLSKYDCLIGIIQCQLPKQQGVRSGFLARSQLGKSWHTLTWIASNTSLAQSCCSQTLSYTVPMIHYLNLEDAYLRSWKLQVPEKNGNVEIATAQSYYPPPEPMQCCWYGEHSVLC